MTVQYPGNYHSSLKCPWPFSLLLLLLLGTVIFSIHIYGYDLWPADEPRFGLVAREMMESSDYLVPRVNEQPYREKPPLLFWSIVLASWKTGDVTAATARVPSVFFALLTFFCTFMLALRMYGQKTAIWSAVILLTGLRFWWQARTCQTDMVLTGCLSVTLYAFFCWERSRRSTWFVLMLLSVAAAVYAKGPPGIVFPLLFVVFRYAKKSPFVTQKSDPPDLLWLIVSLIVVPGALIALWLIPANMAIRHEVSTDTGRFILANLSDQTFGRFVLGGSKAQWPWYYLVNLPVDWFPWSLFFPLIIYHLWHNRKGKIHYSFLAAWIVPAFLFFSICVGKRAIYLLPLYPAIAILMASALCSPELSKTKVSLSTTTRRIFFALIPLGFLLAFVDQAAILLSVYAVYVLWQPEYEARKILICLSGLMTVLALVPVAMRYTAYAAYWDYPLVVFSVCAFAVSASSVFLLYTRRGSPILLITISFLVLLPVTVLTVFPVVNWFKSARPFCTPVRKLSEEGHEFRLYSMAFSREEYVFYSRKPHTEIFTGMVEMPLPENMSMLEIGIMQKRLRKDIVHGVQDVELDNVANITDDDIAMLRASIRNTIARDEAIDQVFAEAFYEALTYELEAFGQEWEHEPAFMFIQESDWRWLVALYPHARSWTVVRIGSVGRRNVMLLANNAGKVLLTAPI